MSDQLGLSATERLTLEATQLLPAERERLIGALVVSLHGRQDEGGAGPVVPASSLLETSTLLKQVCDEAAHEGWDGYGARAISAQVSLAAEAFLRALPHTYPPPEIVPEPDGEVAFEWQRRPDQILSVSIDGRGGLSYAGLFGRNRIHGVEAFDRGIPEMVLANLARLYST